MLKFHDGKKVVSQAQLQKVIGAPLPYSHKGKNSTIVVTAINRRGDYKIEIQGYNERSGNSRILNAVFQDGRMCITAA